MASWDNIANGQRIEIGLVQIDIAGSSRIQGPTESVKLLKDILRSEATSIVNRKGGKPFPWAGDGGAFMFRVDNAGEVAAMVLCALQVLSNMPAVNDEIATRTGISVPISIRVSCDIGTVAYDRDPSGIHGDALNRFFKSEREISIVDNVVISERVLKELPENLRARCQFLKESNELQARIYRLDLPAESPKPTRPDATRPLSALERRTNIERLSQFIASQESLRGNVEIVKMVKHVPVLEPTGFINLPSNERQMAEERLKRPFNNDAHAVLSAEPNWNDDPIVMQFSATDYIGICALSGADKLPVSTISVSVVVLCPELRELYLHRRDPSSRTYRNHLHTYGGAYMPPGITKRDDDFDLITTAQREVQEELNLAFRRSSDISMMLSKELKTGFVQLALLGVDVSAADVAGSRHNWEGKKVVVSFDDFPERLISTEEEWVPTGKVHLLAWLGLGAPGAGPSPRFGRYNALELFDAAIS